MISSRDRNIVIKSQFNINGSRGKDAGKFVSDYVSRDAATDRSLAYVPDPNKVPVRGDGAAFTLDAISISRQDTLDLADHIQELHETGVRAIQQMVISFDQPYLIEQKIIPPDLEITRKGDFRGNYDDVRLRHAIQKGVQALLDNEGYRDGRAIACIQRDTRHLHAHVVVYEDAKKISRKRGREEKGVIKESSFNELAHNIDRSLSLTKAPGLVPIQKALEPEKETQQESKPVEKSAPQPTHINDFLRILQEKEREEALSKDKTEQAANRILKTFDSKGHVVDEKTPD